MLKYFFTYCSVIFLCFQSVGQTDQITEKESQLQQKFIEAKTEVLMTRYDQAEKKFLEIIKENETIGAVHFELGKVYEAKGDNERAIGSYNRAITLEKNNKWYYLQKLYLLKKLNAYTEAATVCEQLTKVDPTSADYYYDWATYALYANNPQLALTALDKLEEKLGPNLNIAEKKIRIYQNLNQADNIKSTIEKLLVIAPSCVPCLKLQARYFADVNQPKEATEVWKKILTLDPADTEAKISIAAGLKSAGDDLGFLESIKPLFVNNNVSYDTKMKELVPYIQKLAKTKDPKLGEALVTALNMLEQTNPDNAKTYAAMADVAQNTGKFKEAAELYKKCLQLDKNVFDVWEQRLYILDQIRDYPQMLKTSEELLDLYPGFALAAYWNGLALLRNGKADDALSILSEGLMSARNNPANQYKLQILKAMAFARKNDIAKSQEAFKAARELNPEIDWAYFAEARVIADIPEKLKDAIKLCDQAIKINPDNFEAIATKAYVLSKNNETDKARALYEESLAKGGIDYPEILEEYGDFLHRLNDNNAALRYWKIAIDKGTPLPVLRKKIDEVKL